MLRFYIFGFCILLLTFVITGYCGLKRLPKWGEHDPKIMIFALLTCVNSFLLAVMFIGLLSNV